jgi:hypothetical protein
MRSLTGFASSLSGLPSSLPSSGSLNSEPSYSSGASRASALRTISTYSRVRASGRRNGTPCQPSDTCGPETPRPRRKRPPESTSRVAAAMAVAAGVRAGICMSAEPSPIRSVRAARAPSTETASWPQASATQTESRPTLSACSARAICSSPENQGQ